MLNTLGLANKVKLYLTYSIQWSNVTTLTITDVSTLNNNNNNNTTATTNNNSANFNNENDRNSITYMLKGENPKSGEMEYILAISKRIKITLRDLDLIFMKIEQIDNKPVESIDKILIAIADSDGSILFYYVHRGIKNIND
ncbi:hypothetical protein C6P40_001528 [Pichia californica]|uniref:tRNA-splicing endonuclease subunit Sen15 domain-containing protein n=1 Tax=Pichia californica TaxID=460514 RepID=A0A9P6WIX8_9ASCO|nr:hypothetical protein C6P42_001595 [[Candida] californica]KAG0688014.1 hypothetical protein C6P40_001528 [[Candida] californica]